MTLAEPVEVEPPGKPTLRTFVSVELRDDDRSVVGQLAPIFPPGTLVRLRGGAEWLIERQQPPVVSRYRPSRVTLPWPSSEPVAAVLEPPTPGTPYRPKRKAMSGFRVKAIEGETVLTDDGRTIAFDELGRCYRQLGS